MPRMDIKICGLSTAESVAAALEGGASHIGFIFFEKSPRNVTPQQAALLAAPARGKVRRVAVTVDAGDDFLDAIVATMQPDMLQLHGKETPQRISDLKQRHGLPVMKAFAIEQREDFDAIAPYRAVADAFLFDAKPPRESRLPGGNGVSFDWALLQALDRDLPYMLSGGLNLANLREALTIAHPPGIDVSSGVETAPGVKSAALIRRFLDEAQSVTNSG